MSADEPTPFEWPLVLRTLLGRDDLSPHVARAAMAEILAGRASPAQIAGFVVGLRMKGETVEEMAEFVEAMLDASERVVLGPGTVAVDTCGTGGNDNRRVGAFNISTLAGLVIAGAGAKVCKHGNRRASSTCGSGDLLDALGVAIDLGPEGVARCVAETGFGFCLAPRYHAAMRHAGPTRRELGVPTVFNYLGPLSNPAGVACQVLGVSDPGMAPKMIGVLQARSATRALVVHADDGLDELTTTTTSTILELRDGAIRTYTLDPTDLGLPLASPASIRGGDAGCNAELAGAVLSGEKGPHRDIVLLNAAAGLIAAGIADDLAQGLDAATASLDSGRAADVLQALVRVSNEAKAAEPAPAPA